MPRKMCENQDDESTQFHEMELDDRILKAIASLSWSTPTLIQEKAIPLILEGKDVLVRARTGSGKTAAFAVPVVQMILTCKQHTVQRQEVKALLLAPSKELCTQICNVIKQLTRKCSRTVKCVDISPSVDVDAQKPLLIEHPDIVVSTPTRALLHLKAGHLRVKDSLSMLVVDEADLIFSFGHDQDMKDVIAYLPNIHQTILASATLTDDVNDLKHLLLHNPVVLKLEEPALAPTSQLHHYRLLAEELDKVTILYALLKLRLIRGKTIIFVNTVDRCYKIKLYLEQFGIRTCVLNSELPAAIRCQSVQQFNDDVYDIIVASDEKALEAPGQTTGDTASTNSSSRRSKRRKDRESGASRGIDFHCVANVINFDFPLDVSSYIHRAGRTARGRNTGSVLSFVSIAEKERCDSVDEHLKAIYTLDTPATTMFKAYQFQLDEVEAFKYRARDAWRAVTRIAVREARLKEIKAELFNCQKLKSYFVDNPSDFNVLRHDKALHTVRQQQHLRNVPDYIVPPALKNIAGVGQKPPKRKRDFRNLNAQAAKFQRTRSNPLLSMSFDGGKRVKQA